MNIDVHNHVIPDAVLDLVANDSVYGVHIENGRWTSKNIGTFPLIDAWRNVDAKLREMDGKELDGAVISAAPKPLFYYELDRPDQARITKVTNASIAEFCKGHEDRLRWMAHLPLAFPDYAADVMTEAWEQGASGVELGTSAGGMRLDSSDLDVLWSRLETLGVPIFLHPAYESDGAENHGYALGVALGLPFEVTNALQRLICGRVLDRFPNLRIVAALGGGFFPYVAGRIRHYGTFQPELQDAPADPWSYVGQLKFDTHLHDPVALRFLIDKAGSSNVMIGTDCSFLSCSPAPLEELREAVHGDDAALEMVSCTNAKELFWSHL